MMLPIAEAATLVGKSRPALMRAIKTGKISATKDEFGRIRIDPAELTRVYSPATRPDSHKNAELTLENREMTARLQAENEGLRARLFDTQAERDRCLEQVEEWRQQASDWKKQAESLLPKPRMVVTEPPRKPDSQRQDGGSIWSKLFGR